MIEILPFSRKAFLDVFARYNEAIWPLQLVAIMTGSGSVISIPWGRKASVDIVVPILTIMWVWTGLVYHGIFFSVINPAAYAFAALFVVQGGALLVFRDSLRFEISNDWSSWVGLSFIAYALILYPIVSVLTDQVYPHMPMFGVAPCPLVWFSFGLLLLTTCQVPRWLLVIPLVWSLIGGSAVLLLDMASDWPLLLSGMIAVPLLVRRKHRSQANSSHP